LFRLAVFGRRAGIRGTIRRLVAGRRADLQLLEPELQLLDLVPELLRRAPVVLPLQPGQLHLELLDLQSLDQETRLRARKLRGLRRDDAAQLGSLAGRLGANHPGTLAAAPCRPAESRCRWSGLPQQAR